MIVALKRFVFDTENGTESLHISQCVEFKIISKDLMRKFIAILSILSISHTIYAAENSDSRTAASSPARFILVHALSDSHPFNREKAKQEAIQRVDSICRSYSGVLVGELFTVQTIEGGQQTVAVQACQF